MTFVTFVAFKSKMSTNTCGDAMEDDKRIEDIVQFVEKGISLMTKGGKFTFPLCKNVELQVQLDDNTWLINCVNTVSEKKYFDYKGHQLPEKFGAFLERFLNRHMYLEQVCQMTKNAISLIPVGGKFAFTVSFFETSDTTFELEIKKNTRNMFIIQCESSETDDYCLKDVEQQCPDYIKSFLYDFLIVCSLTKLKL